MKIRDNKGSITVFVLVALLFMTGFLIISFGSNINKSKSAKEQFNIMSSIYSRGDGDANAYERAYTAIRRKNAQILSKSSENSSTLELTKTFVDKISNYKIYGNSIQDGTPSPTNPIEVESLGDKTVNLFDVSKVHNIEGTLKSENGVLTVSHYGVGGGTLATLCPELQVGQTVTLSGTTTGLNYIYIGKTWGFGQSITITQADLDANVYFYNTSYGGDPATITNIQIQLGTNPTEYEPYGKYKIPVKVSNEDGGAQTFNIILDEPLRKVGEISDYIDFSTGEIVRNIYVLEDFTVTMSDKSIYRKLENVVRFGVRNAEAPVAKSGVAAVLCEFLPGGSISAQWSSGNECFFVHPSSGIHYYFSFSKERIGVTSTDTDEEILQKGFDYLSGITKRKIYYALETPPDPEKIELPELNTYEDYTKIEVLTEVAPSKIEATYYGYTME